MIHGQKCIIKKMNVQDLKFRNELANNPEVNKFIGFSLPVSMEKTYKWFRRRQNDKTCLLFIIWDKNNFGRLGYVRIGHESREAEIHIIVHPNCQGQGVATDATKTMIRYCLERLGVSKIFVRVQAKNKPALRMFSKAGFKKSGEIVMDFTKK